MTFRPYDLVVRWRNHGGTPALMNRTCAECTCRFGDHWGDELRCPSRSDMRRRGLGIGLILKSEDILRAHQIYMEVCMDNMLHGWL